MCLPEFSLSESDIFPELSVGEVLLSKGFTLYEAMSALEVPLFHVLIFEPIFDNRLWSQNSFSLW